MSVVSVMSGCRNEISRVSRKKEMTLSKFTNFTTKPMGFFVIMASFRAGEASYDTFVKNYKENMIDATVFHDITYGRDYRKDFRLSSLSKFKFSEKLNKIFSVGVIFTGSWIESFIKKLLFLEL